jgi:alpha-tubulin suppressor-like RCC1 family protein
VAKSVAAGGEHCFVIDMQGRLWAWGWNNYGQLGPLSEEKVTEPVIVY